MVTTFLICSFGCQYSTTFLTIFTCKPENTYTSKLCVCMHLYLHSSRPSESYNWIKYKIDISINLWEVPLQVKDFSGSMFSVGIKVNFSYVKVSWMFWGPERGPIIWSIIGTIRSAYRSLQCSLLWGTCGDKESWSNIKKILFWPLCLHLKEAKT